MKRFVSYYGLIFAAGLLLSLSWPGSGRSALKTGDVVVPSEVNGELFIEIQDGSGWKPLTSLKYGRFYQQKGLVVPARFTQKGPVRLKITQAGGGAAHIDSIFLRHRPPVALQGEEDPLALDKLSKTDFDVIDASHQSLVFEFDPPKKAAYLSIIARIEPLRISQTPFQFPLQNLYQPMTTASAFYTYEWDSNQGGPNSETGQEAPFFKEYCLTGSGHPPGYTYGWVKNDAHFLYVRIDFTADNTTDGDKDYAKVYVKTRTGLKEFKISENNTQWGYPVFIYTEKVSYQHKVYFFQIPLDELEIEAVFMSQPLELAFAAYGTAPPPGSKVDPALAFNPDQNTYITVFIMIIAPYTPINQVYGQRLNWDGSPLAEPFIISNAAPLQQNPRIAFDTANLRYLAVWYDQRITGDSNIYGQLFEANGSLLFHSPDVNFPITTHPKDQHTPAVAYDSVNHRFLVVWLDSRVWTSHIFGQFIQPNGSPYLSPLDQNLPIATYNSGKFGPAIAFDPVSQRYLVAFSDNRDTKHRIYGQLISANGAPYGTPIQTNFPISRGDMGADNPDIAYDNVNQRFLVVWASNNGSVYDIHGQLITPDGTPYYTPINTNFPISTANGSKFHPAVVFEPFNQRYLVAWISELEHNGSIHGQYVNADGTLSSSPANVNFLIIQGNNVSCSQGPIIAHNPNCANTLAGWDIHEPEPIPYTLGFKTVGNDCAPEIQASPMSHDFGSRLINRGDAEQTFTITNLGYNTLNIGPVGQTDPVTAPFSITEDGCSNVTLSPQASCTFMAGFAPETAGPFADTFSVSSNDADEPLLSIAVTGTGTTKDILILDSSGLPFDGQVDFGETVLGDRTVKTITVLNNGSAILTLGEIAADDPLAAPFALVTDTCSGATLEQDGSCSLELQFEPPTIGSFSDTFAIPFEAPEEEDITVTVNGQGVLVDTDTGSDDAGTNSPPTPPELIYPPDKATAIPVSVSLTWKRSTDPDHDVVTYDLYYCTNQDFSGCSPEQGISIRQTSPRLHYAWGWGGLALGLSLFGLFFKRRKWMGLILLFIATTVIYATCSDDSRRNNGEDEIAYPVVLKANTTYYWKVVARDGRGGETASELWSFTTE